MKIRKDYFGFNDSVIDRVLTQNAFKKLIIRVSTLDVVIEEGTDFAVTYHGREAYCPHVQEKEGELQLEQPELVGTVVFHNLSGTEEKLRLTIPSGKSLKSIRVKTSNGDLTVEKVDSDDLNLKSSNGDLKAAKATFKSAELLTSNGNVTVKSVNATDLRLLTTDGDVAVENVKADTLNVTTTNGNIGYDDVTIRDGKARLMAGDFKVKGGRIYDRYSVKNVDGDNRAKNVQVADYHLRTVVGDNQRLRTSAPADEKDGHRSLLSLQTVAGDNRVY